MSSWQAYVFCSKPSHHLDPSACCQGSILPASTFWNKAFEQKSFTQRADFCLGRVREVKATAGCTADSIMLYSDACRRLSYVNDVVQFNFGKPKAPPAKIARETVIPEPSYSLPIGLAGMHLVTGESFEHFCVVQCLLSKHCRHLVLHLNMSIEHVSLVYWPAAHLGCTGNCGKPYCSLLTSHFTKSLYASF